MGNLTDSADGDNIYSVQYRITLKSGEVIEGCVEVAAQDDAEAFQLAQGMNELDDLLDDEEVPKENWAGASLEWGDVELEEEND